jgi:hypothetical protein
VHRALPRVRYDRRCRYEICETICRGLTAIATCYARRCAISDGANSTSNGRGYKVSPQMFLTRHDLHAFNSLPRFTCAMGETPGGICFSPPTSSSIPCWDSDEGIFYNTASVMRSLIFFFVMFTYPAIVYVIGRSILEALDIRVKVNWFRS